MMEMKKLVDTLNKACEAYYGTGNEIMDNAEYDRLYDQLLLMETSTQTVLPDSPTKRVGFEVVSSLEKKIHTEPALSLDKTKDRDSLPGWLKDKKGVLSWKEDGLTCVCEYEDGKLVSACTRGNGSIGEVITHNAPFFKGLPLQIPDKRRIRVRGEAVISYKDFEEINEYLGGVYKNPRNLASGSVRTLSTKQSASRRIHFVAFTLINALELGVASYKSSLSFLDELGFECVEHELVNAENVVDAVGSFEKKLPDNRYPSDGLVITYDDLVYGESLGTTGKFPRHSLAFKWKDETAETVLREITWSASRTGLLNPVAVFDTVELEGTSVSRASLHNVSYIADMNLQAGDRILVYKSNMIIPCVLKNLDMESHPQLSCEDIAGSIKCPVCGSESHLTHSDVSGSDTVTLYCKNPDCAAKNIGALSHFCKRDCMNIVGMSDATIETLVSNGVITEFSDFFHMDRYKYLIPALEGYGDKSYQKMLSSAKASSKSVPFVNFIHALGIPNFGKSQAKLLFQFIRANHRDKKDLTMLQILACLIRAGLNFSLIDGIGEVMNRNLREYFTEDILNDIIHQTSVTSIGRLLKCINFADEWGEDETSSEGSDLSGKIFVITGSLEHFKNRAALVDDIESKGGKVSGSISSKTSYLICNDKTSNSGKSKKAKELGIPVITEKEFLNL